MNITNPKEVMIKSLEIACAFDAYLKTLDLYCTNISTDSNYQKNFNSYYRVRRDRNWLKEYYDFMENHKNDDNISFEKILRKISSVPHKAKNGMITSIEASFASKMLATINPNYPIWDSQVVKALDISIDPSLVGEEKIKAYVEAYTKLTQEIGNFIKTEEGELCIEHFDATFPNLKNLNSFKKIDYYLWNIGK